MFSVVYTFWMKKNESRPLFLTSKLATSGLEDHSKLLIMDLVGGDTH